MVGIYQTIVCCQVLTLQKDTVIYHMTKSRKVVIGLVVFTVLVFIVEKTSVNRVRVSGESMLPTLSHGQKGLCNKFSLYFRTSSRGDIIIYNDPTSENTLVVKRVIGIPGDSILIVNGKVFLNGRFLSEPYLPRYTYTYGDGEWFLGKNEYFALGDNRNNSMDCRDYGPINIKRIKGFFVP